MADPQSTQSDWVEHRHPGGDVPTGPSSRVLQLNQVCSCSAFLLRSNTCMSVVPTKLVVSALSGHGMTLDAARSLAQLIILNSLATKQVCAWVHTQRTGVLPSELQAN